MSPGWLFLAAGSGLLLGFVVGVNMGFHHAQRKFAEKFAAGFMNAVRSGGVQFVQSVRESTEKLH